jgi:hypothetical protein
VAKVTTVKDMIMIHLTIIIIIVLIKIMVTKMVTEMIQIEIEFVKVIDEKDY